MKDIRTIASRYNLTEDFYNCEFNDQGAVISLELFDGEYEDFPSGDHILEFASHFIELKRLHVDVYDCEIQTLRPLERLVFLELLDLECSSILSHLESIQCFKNLRSLHIQSSEITDLSPLVNCLHLTSIRLTQSKISDLTSLKSLIHLNTIDFTENRISNIDVLRHLEHLTAITLSNNNISNVNALKSNHQLRYIQLANNRIKDLTPIAESIQVINLGVNNNQIERIQALENYTHNFANNRITDISILQNNKMLEYVVLSNNPIQTLSPITELTSIITLYASRLNLKASEKNITFKSELSYLDLSHNQIENTTFLDNQPQLLQLNLSHNRLQTCTWVKRMYRIKHIDLSYNMMTIPFPIYMTNSLDAVDLRGNDIGSNLWFERYKGIASQGSIYTDRNRDQQMGLISDLEKEVADYYKNNGDLESALAYYYLSKGSNNIEVLNMYLIKLFSTPIDDLVYIKYYFYRIIMAFNNSNDEPEKENKVYTQIKSYLDGVGNMEQREHLLRYLENFKRGNRANPTHIFNPLEFYFYERKHQSPYLTDEIIYLKGMGFDTDRIIRTDLDRGVFYLQALYHRNSPYFYTLKQRIRTTLNNDFAYTNTERLAHNYYMDRINNIDQYILEEPKFESIDIAIGVQIKLGYKFVYCDVDMMKQFNGSTHDPSKYQIYERVKGKNIRYYILWGLFILFVLLKALRWF